MIVTEKTRTAKAAVRATFSLNTKPEEAREMIDEAAATGAYLISEEASEALATLKRELDKNDGPGSWVTEIERHHAAVKACVTKMKSYAEMDLRSRHRGAARSWAHFALCRRVPQGRMRTEHVARTADFAVCVSCPSTRRYATTLRT
jgi:hypothetical protein